MHYRIAADAVLLLHLGFVVFALLGAILALRRPRLALLQLPAAAWAAYIEFADRTCPLTLIENRLREAAGDSGYREGFIEHYLLPIIYPGGLTRNVELVLAALVLVVNGAIYGWMLFRPRSSGERGV